MPTYRDIKDTATCSLVAHVAPFVAWLLLLQLLGSSPAWTYGLRSAVCLGLLVYLKPWIHYGSFHPRHVPLAVGSGVAVFLAWVLVETPWMAAEWPTVRQAYMMFAVFPPWTLTELAVDRTFAPESSGWTFTVARLLGSAFVIAIIEEFFWRGFLYRWMISSEFVRVDLGTWHWRYFSLVALIFGVEHRRWVAGVVAGLAYGWVMLRTKDIWATSLAHVVTNLTLGVYVVCADQYEFWS